MFKSDTICAIATGLGKSAIGMIRVSGPDAINICDGIFEGKKKLTDMDSFTAAFGRIVDRNPANGECDILDEAIVLVMKAPHTYTTENTVEIDLHGGTLVIRKVLELLVKSGVRVAEPGEFTKRAFLGGRIDMTEAEAVMDVINAETDRALKTSVNQLTGKLREEIAAIREKILYHTAYIESALDDPENYSLDGFGEKLSDEINDILSRIDRLVSTADEGRLIREGIRTAIVGRPNVGKSSILNLLLGEDRAIVTDIEGTTRDTLEEYVNVDGILLKLIDTAGIRDTADVVERIGVDKARSSMEDADLVMLILDGSHEPTESDMQLLDEVSGRNAIYIINKTDKDIVFTGEMLRSLLKNKNPEIDNFRIVELSAKTSAGLENLRDMISDMFFHEELDYNDQLYITKARHKSSLIEAEKSLKRVIESIEEGLGEDFYTIDLMAAYESLGEIIGETLEDDLADKIFSEFCMGK
ncbi:MAG: tRNA uridine-5-carboxymethylaminomethyl(34) synthesis GTPase MnmE [Eubacterium sp.]|nr:tRNA uridine-5-carboxymethylaminomethyl(34) synthesis GTPase MnmE [Eubacterium sp.]